MKSIRSYFSSKCDVSGASKDAGSFQVPCHVRQQGAEDQEMWNLVPSFLLQEDGGGGEVMGSISPAPWTCNITAPILKQDEKPSSSATHSSDAVCEQLQKEFPSSHIRQTFDRYCLLSSKAISCKEHLICSIPVVRTQDGVQVDDMALSRKEIAVNGESLPWTQVYAPTQASHVIGNHKAITTLLEWLQSWRGRKSNTKCSESVKRHVEMQEDPDFLPTKELAEDKEKTSDVSAVLLHGPHGSGKTAAVYACATQIGLKVFEVHAGHLRSKSLLIQKLKEATLSHRVTPFSKTKFSSKSVGLGSNSVILFDEIDVVFPGDSGFLQALQDIISSTKCPVILTCSDPPVKLNTDVLRIQFNLPSERELSIHSSLIGVVNGWPLTLEESHKLCHHFSGDIRRVVLHLQLMLSGKPTDPVAVLDDQVEEECVVANPSANCSLSVESYRHMHCPWRVQTARYLAGHFTTPSHLDMTSILHHQMSQVDNVQSPHQQKELLHCPWTARPKASMLDQLPDYTPSPCTCGSTIRHTLCSMLYSEDPAPNHSNQSAAIRSFTKQALMRTPKVLDELFSKSWVTSRTSMATEGLPLLHVMYESGIPDNRFSRRQSRHYFHPHHLELSELITKE